MCNTSRIQKLIFRGILFFSLLTLLLFVQGCGFPSKKLDPEIQSEIKTIGLLPVRQPSFYLCYDPEYYLRYGNAIYVPSGASNFGQGAAYGAAASAADSIARGLVAGLLNVPTREERSAQIANLLYENQCFVAPELSNAITEALLEDGYRIEMIDLNTETEYDKYGLVKDYTCLPSHVDAYLDVFIWPGCSQNCFRFYGKEGNCFYEPWLSVSSRMVRPSDYMVIYSHGYDVCRGLVHRYSVINTKVQHGWTEFEDITNNPELFIKWLREDINLVASKIGQDLEHKPLSQ